MCNPQGPYVGRQLIVAEQDKMGDPDWMGLFGSLVDVIDARQAELIVELNKARDGLSREIGETNRDIKQELGTKVRGYPGCLQRDGQYQGQ